MNNMKLMKKFSFLLFLVIILLSITLVESSEVIIVGVKQGDWIEYDIQIKTNHLNNSEITIPPDHNISWARLEIISVQNRIIDLNVQTKFSNATVISGNTSLNLDDGTLGDNFIIPANLTYGDSFYNKYQGNIIITNLQQETIAGADRIVFSGATEDTVFDWDQLTGILINAESTFNGYSLITQINKTNMWAPQKASLSPEKSINLDFKILGVSVMMFSILLFSIIVILVVILSIIKLRNKSENYKIY